jgi:hypothetical protein
MKRTMQLQKRLPAVMAGVLLGTINPCLAADLTYTFDSDAQGWYAADGHGTLTWDATHGRGGGGCLKITMAAETDTEVDPRVDVAFDTTGYFSVEFDMMVDAASGTDGAGNYGNLQMVARDAGWSWDSMWFGGVDTSFNSYRHVKKAFTSAYGLKAYLQFQLASSMPPYLGDVTVYIDNVVIRDGTPPNPATLFDFAWPEETTMSVSSWAGGTPAADSVAVSQDTSPAPLHPDGSLKLVVNYNASNSGWQEGDVQLNPYDWDPSKFTWLEFDFYMDAPTGLSDYGGLQVFEIDSNWQWQNTGWQGLSAANVGTWTHYRVPLTSMALSHGLVVQVGGGMTVPVTYYVDNLVAWRPATPPQITKLAKSQTLGRGAVVTMDQPGPANQWQRDAIVTPANGIYTWYGFGEVTYAFTLTNFPDAIAHPGFEAHMFLVDGDTLANESGNETYGAVDWNASDIIVARLENNATGGVDFSFRYKTNLPNANPDQTLTTVHCPSALGTWGVSFGADTTSVTLSGPEGVLTNFSLPQEVADKFNCLISFLQFGVFKNDGSASGVNDGASATFSRVQMIGGYSTFDDSFSGPGLTANYAWRVTSSSAVSWTPSGTAWWLTWTLPDDGFTPLVSGTVHGPYHDAGVTYTYGLGASRFGAVPAASVPAGDAAFFRLKK